MTEKIIISLGGSLIVPAEIDGKFVKSFRDLILWHVAEGREFVIITGGGKICRKYQDAAKELSSPKDDDLDWIGIAALKLNAEFMRVVFGAHADPKIISNPSEKFSSSFPVIIGSAYEPGHSTDWDAVLMAKNIGARRIINLSNIDFVYDSDPKKNPNAKKFEALSWAEYRALIPKDWDPGLNSPFDPTAAKAAEEAGIEVAIMNGKPIDNLKKYLAGEKFAGTEIK